jgi:hypothetical protein
MSSEEVVDTSLPLWLYPNLTKTNGEDGNNAANHPGWRAGAGGDRGSYLNGTGSNPNGIPTPVRLARGVRSTEPVFQKFNFCQEQAMQPKLLPVLVLGICALISPPKVFAQSSYQGPVISGSGTTVRGSGSGSVQGSQSAPTIRETRPIPGAFPKQQSAPAPVQQQPNHFEVQISGETPHRQQ